MINPFTDAIVGFGQNASNYNKAEEGDYQNDEGLLVCGKCHTPKQTDVEMFGRTVRVACMCDCKAQEVNRLEEEQRARQRKLALEEFRRYVAFPNEKMTTWTFENDDGTNPKLTQIAKNYVEKFEEYRQKSQGLLLSGGVGTGKSYISVCIANALIDKGYTAMLTSIPRIERQLRDDFEGAEDLIKSINNNDLVILDDFGTERSTEYMNEIVISIINSRYESGKPLIVTTNLKANELRNPQDIAKDRVYSRLVEMCIYCGVQGVDRRRAKAKQMYREQAKELAILNNGGNNNEE